MRLVVDTNVMVEAVTTRGPYHRIFRSVIDKTNNLVLSNEILLEYFEIFERIFPKQLLEELSIFFHYATGILRIDPHYRFRLIESDEDDNKFVDCAICGNCDFLITSDHHFDILKKSEFPRVEVIRPEAFVSKFL